MTQVSATLPRPLILGSTSRYRRELLNRLHLPFEVVAPEVDETPQAGEAPATLAQRLALAKAQAVARQHPEAVVIGSDQVPTWPANRWASLATMRGRWSNCSACAGRPWCFKPPWPWSARPPAMRRWNWRRCACVFAR